MPVREEKRNLNSIPVGSLGIIPLSGCKELGDKVDKYLVKWRAERESEHKDSLAFAGYQRDSYIIHLLQSIVILFQKFEECNIGS